MLARSRACRCVRGSSRPGIAKSTKPLTPTGRGRRLDRIQHAMPNEPVLERRAEMRSVAIVAGKTCPRLGNVRPETRLRRGPSIVRWHGQDLERALRPPAAAYGQLEELRLAAIGGHLQVAFGTVDLPEQVGSA